MRLAGFRLEAAAISKLKQCGVRVERATDYEDEILGIDCWLFLQDVGWDETQWRWYPVNLTLRSDMDKYQNSSKYHKCFGKGVLPIRLTFDNLKLRPLKVWEKVELAIHYALHDFALCGQPLLSREEAKQKELRMEL